MRIISKFHDYYDSVMIYGQDKTVVYQREEKKIFDAKIKTKDLELYSVSIGYYKNSIWERSFDPFIIVFCGKVYYTFYFEGQYFYSYEPLEKIILDTKDNKFIKAFYEGWRSIPKTLKELFEKSGKQESNLNLELNCPIILIKEFEKDPYSYLSKNKNIQIIKRMVLNPILREIEFFKIKDAFSTFQELSMFVSGILTKPEKEMPIIPDKLKLQSKGFDEWSFRKKSKS